MNMEAIDSHSAFPSAGAFTFLTNHAYVLLLIARAPDMRMRDLASEVGITERAVQRIIDELAAAGYLLVTKEGRRNHYELQVTSPLRNPMLKHLSVGDLLQFVGGPQLPV